jgi:hypothetical protein
MVAGRGLCLPLAATLGHLLGPILFLHQGNPQHIDVNFCGLELWLGPRLVAGPVDLFALRFDQLLTTSLDIAWSRPGSQ